MLRAVVPLMRGEWFSRFRRSVIHKLVALALRHSARPSRCFSWRRPRLNPCLAAVIGALNDLPEPAAGLRRENPVWVRRRSLHVVDLPARDVRAADFPVLALAVRAQDKRALACAHQYSYSAHLRSLQL